MQRFFVAFSLAVLAAAGTAGSAFADFNPTKDERSIGAFVVAAALMFVLLCIYAVKWYFGLDQQPENPDVPDMSNASLPAGGTPHH
jgi:hypothetical protein